MRERKGETERERERERERNLLRPLGTAASVSEELSLLLRDAHSLSVSAVPLEPCLALGVVLCVPQYNALRVCLAALKGLNESIDQGMAGVRTAHAPSPLTAHASSPPPPPFHMLAPRPDRSEHQGNKAAATNHELERFEAIFKQGAFALELGHVCFVVFYQLRLSGTLELGVRVPGSGFCISLSSSLLHTYAGTQTSRRR